MPLDGRQRRAVAAMAGGDEQWQQRGLGGTRWRAQGEARTARGSPYEADARTTQEERCGRSHGPQVWSRRPSGVDQVVGQLVMDGGGAEQSTTRPWRISLAGSLRKPTAKQRGSDPRSHTARRRMRPAAKERRRVSTAACTHRRRVEARCAWPLFEEYPAIV